MSTGGTLFETYEDAVAYVQRNARAGNPQTGAIFEDRQAGGWRIKIFAPVLGNSSKEQDDG